MMKIDQIFEKYLQIESLSVVLIGDFNPVIFQPFWLANKCLIREDEAKNAIIDVIHNEIVKYELDWISIQISKNRCEFKTSKAPYFDPLKDLIVGIFKILNETPINSFGINHVYDFSLQTPEQYYNFGKKLTPLEFWNDDLNDPRLNQLEIIENERKDGQDGKRRISIETSTQSISFGIAIKINNHFALASKDFKNDFIPVLERNWSNSFEESKSIIENLLNKIDI